MADHTPMQPLNAARRSHLAAESDAETDAYLARMQQVFIGEQQQQQQRHSPSHHGHPSPASATAAAATRPKGSCSGRPSSGQLSSPGSVKDAARQGQTSRQLMQRRPGVSAGGPAASPAAAAAAQLMTEPSTAPGGTAQRWRAGPVDTAGLLVQLSERPLLCSAALWHSQQVVLGGSDHACYVVDVAAGRRVRTLYSKTCGHTEWVTCVAALPDGRLLSGGMDGQLWLWLGGSGCTGSQVRSAHAAPVSQLAALSGPAAGLAVSCSYDKTVKVWDARGHSSSSGSRRGGVGGSVREAAVLRGHQGPVLQLAVQPLPGAAEACQELPRLLTGDRKGGLVCWDLGTSSSCWAVASAHAGHVTAAAWLQLAAPGAAAAGSSGGSWCALSGGQDGRLRAWDCRSGTAVADTAVHADQRGKGAVGSILTGIGCSRQLVATAGADGSLAVLDPSMSWRVLHRVRLTDFPYSLAAGPAGSGLAVCGCGGSVHVVDVERGLTLYALGAGKAGAIRAMEVCDSQLVCACDDGHVVVYSFVR